MVGKALSLARDNNRISEIITNNESKLLSAWMENQISDKAMRKSLKESELREQSQDFMNLLGTAVKNGSSENIYTNDWEPMRKMLDSVTRMRGEAGFSPSETATFVFSFKKPLISLIRSENKDIESMAEDMWTATQLLDKLGLYITEAYQKTREDVIARQQQDMLELSTPVVSLAEGVLALPLIGTLDSARTQVVMESLLQRIVETGSIIAIIDITGVPTVDTLVAQHLLKTVTAARLMGAECIISGIRPQIAQTIVHLGVELGNVITKATLAAAFKVALERNGMAIVKIAKPIQEKK